MSDISNIPGKREPQKLNPVNNKREPLGSVEQEPPVAPLEFPEDEVQLSKQSPVSKSDLDRYVNLLKEMPDEVMDEAKIARVKSDLSQGLYGEEALKDTVDGLLQDLGIR